MNSELQQVRRRIEQLDELLQAGSLSTDAHRSARSGLEQELVALVLARPQATIDRVKPSARLWLGLGLFVLLVAGAGYRWTGTPAALTGAAPAQEMSSNDAAAAPGNEQIEAMVQALADRLKGQPNDAVGWGMLARSYAALGRHAQSLPAYVKALELNQNDTTLMVDYADALALQQGRSLAGVPMVWVRKALAIDPSQPKALLLAGSDAFDRKDFAQAAKDWTAVAQGGDAQSPLVKHALDGLEEIKRLGLGATGQQPAPVDSAKPAASQARLSGSVSLDPKLVASVNPDDAVFIYARAAEGSRMPLAMLRRQVKDLPMNFLLDDSMAMSPQANLSSAREVIVAVRISKSGQAVAQPGDLEGDSGKLAVGSQDIKVLINRILK
jgi:cytochrome c-type biogenesis protein CcmH